MIIHFTAQVILVHKNEDIKVISVEKRKIQREKGKPLSSSSRLPAAPPLRSLWSVALPSDSVHTSLCLYLRKYPFKNFA